MIHIQIHWQIILLLKNYDSKLGRDCPALTFFRDFLASLAFPFSRLRLPHRQSLHSPHAFSRALPCVLCVWLALGQRAQIPLLDQAIHIISHSKDGCRFKLTVSEPLAA